MRLAIILLALVGNYALAVVAENHPLRPTFNLTQVELGNKYLNASPFFTFRSKDGSLWTVYDRYIVRKQGHRITEHKLPGTSSDYFTSEYSSLIKSAESDSTILVSYNSQLLYFDKFSENWKLWQNLPFDGEIITGLEVLEDQSIWVSTIKNLFFTNGIGHKFEVIEFTKAQQHIKSRFLLATSMYSDSKKTLWISSFLSTIFKVEVKENTTPEIQKIILPGKQNKIIHDIKPFDKGNLLIGASDGLYTYKPETKNLRSLTETGEVNYVDSLQISKNYIWFNSEEKIYTLDRNSRILRQLSTDNFPFDSSSYSSLGLYSDESENIWLAIKGNGLLQYSPYVNKIRPAQGMLLGARNLNLLTLNNRGSKTIISDGEKTQSLDGLVNIPVEAYSYFAEDEDVFLGETGKVTHFRNHTRIAEYTIPGVLAAISSIVVDSRDRLWATDELKGLFVFSSANRPPIPIDKLETKGENQVRFITSNLLNEIVLIYKNEARYIDSSREQLSIDRTIAFESEAISSVVHKPFVITQHKDNRISRLNIETRELEYFSFPEVDNFGCALFSKDSGWWIAEKNGGLFNYPLNVDKPKRYGRGDGLPAGGVDGTHCLQTKDSMLFSSHAGVLETKPEYRITNTEPSTTIITSFLINGVNVKKKQTRDPLDLTPRDFPITVEFYPTSLEFPDNNQVRYKLVGLDNHWKSIDDNSQKISFSHLVKGSYKLIIQSSNNDGVWGKEEIIVWRVIPPTWLTWWAILGYVIVTLALIVMLSQYRVSTLRKRAERLEATVAEHTQQLEQILDKKNEEFANVSHEFRTPLTLVIGPLQKLLTDEANQDKKSSLSMVKRNAFRLLRMVDQLLHLEKFRVQQIVKKVPIRVQPIAKLIGESFAELAKEKDITMTIEQVDDVWIQFTPDALEKILLNLLSNAVKYSRPGDTINFSILKDSENSLKIMVKDSGIGIPVNKQAEIFERFSRVLDNHSEQITGAGIGLSLVKELVESHDGHIELKSTLGEGCCFTVTLPTILEPRATHSTKTDTNDETVINELNNEILDMEIESLVEQTHKADSDRQIQDSELSDSLPTLLIVEDNHDMRSYITSTLSGRFNILTAPNGKEGLDLAREHIPDLVVSDVMMPQMDGFTLCHELKSGELTSHIPLILLTARSDRDSRLRGWKEQADEYLTKPFDAEELNLRVNNLLDIRELLKQRFYSSVLSQPEQLNQTAADSLEEKDDNSQWEDHQKVFLKRFIEQIETNIENPQLKVAEIAKSLAMTERQLYRKLKGVINVTPSEYLKNYRLDKALSLLKSGEPVGNIAFDVGFSSHSYFSRCFKAKFGKSPSEFAN